MLTPADNVTVPSKVVGQVFGAFVELVSVPSGVVIEKRRITFLVPASK